MKCRLYDAHNHLQDERLGPHRAGILRTCDAAGIAKMVVNGSCETDWPEVLALSRGCPQIIPSFGYHPWYVKERTESWKETLIHHLDSAPSGIGEIGLDRWIKDHDFADQIDVFVWQLRLAAERNLPASIHCLQAWGKLFEILRAEPRPACGFLLHSFGGPAEMVTPLAKLGAYFSFPGYFMHERKQRQRDAFQLVPPDRLLIETDAPDQLLPECRIRLPLLDANSGQPINHPANLGAVYRFVAEMKNEPLDKLTRRVEENFLRLFGKVCSPLPDSRKLV